MQDTRYGMKGRGDMDLARKLGIGVLMIVPAFVFGGVVWALVKSWLAVLGLVIVAAVVYGRIVSGRSEASL